MLSMLAKRYPEYSLEVQKIMRTPATKTCDFSQASHMELPTFGGGEI